MKKSTFTYGDIAIVCIVLLVALFLYLSFVFSFWGEHAETLFVYVDGREYAEYKFSEISSPKKVEINTQYGNNILEISKNGARMVEASCKDKIDVQSGMISKPGQVLVCIPNRVTVRISGKSRLNIDKVTY